MKRVTMRCQGGVRGRGGEGEGRRGRVEGREREGEGMGGRGEVAQRVRRADSEVRGW